MRPGAQNFLTWSHHAQSFDPAAEGEHSPAFFSTLLEDDKPINEEATTVSKEVD
jgi:hypothetical protein